MCTNVRRFVWSKGIVQRERVKCLKDYVYSNGSQFWTVGPTNVYMPSHLPVGVPNSHDVTTSRSATHHSPLSYQKEKSLFFFFLGLRPNAGYFLLIHYVSISLHNGAPPLVGLLWTSYQLFAQTFTWQHKTLTSDIHPPGGIWTHNLSMRAAADLRPRPRGNGTGILPY
jgi:hypothetical protein